MAHRSRRDASNIATTPLALILFYTLASGLALSSERAWVCSDHEVLELLEKAKTTERVVGVPHDANKLCNEFLPGVGEGPSQCTYLVMVQTIGATKVNNVNISPQLFVQAVNEHVIVFFILRLAIVNDIEERLGTAIEIPVQEPE